MGKKKKQQQQQFENEAVDKLDHFLATHYKKILGAFAALLVIFIAGYAFNSMNKSKNTMLTDKEGQLEMIMLMTDGNKENVNKFLAMADEFPSEGDYINLKAAEVLVSKGDIKDAAAPLKTAGGEYKELADGLAFDTGVGNVDPAQYLTGSKMGALWHYRAYLAADKARKAEILESFKKLYPKNALLKQIERWDG